MITKSGLSGAWLFLGKQLIKMTGW